MAPAVAQEFHKAFILMDIKRRHNLKRKYSQKYYILFGWNCVVDCSRVLDLYPEHDDIWKMDSIILKATGFQMM
jgi:hypothetical protein